MKDQIFIALVGVLFCYGILVLTLDLKNYCEYANEKGNFFSIQAKTNRSEEEYKYICDEVRREYIHNIIYDKFLNTFYKNVEAKTLDEPEIEQYVRTNTYSHLLISAKILKLTKCSLYCLGLFICIMIIPNIFFYVMKAFLKRILLYIFILFIFEAICNFYLNFSLDILKIIKTIDYFDLRTKLSSGLLYSYFDIIKRFIS